MIRNDPLRRVVCDFGRIVAGLRHTDRLTCNAEHRQGRNAADARRRAALDGWTYHRLSGDRCPLHRGYP